MDGISCYHRELDAIVVQNVLDGTRIRSDGSLHPERRRRNRFAADEFEALSGVGLAGFRVSEKVGLGSMVFDQVP